MNIPDSGIFENLLRTIYRIKFFFVFFESCVNDYWRNRDIDRMRSILLLATKDSEIEVILHNVNQIAVLPETSNAWRDLVIETVSYFEEPRRKTEVEKIISNAICFGKIDFA